jgi:hypothetical protein
MGRGLLASWAFDVDHNAWDYMRKAQKDGSVKTP